MKLYRLSTLRGVPVYVHASTAVMFALALLAALAGGARLFAAVIAYFALILVHELGHASVARRLRCRVRAIELFPVHGRCLFEARRGERDVVRIAWGGVGAQALVLAPAAAISSLPRSIVPEALALSLVVLTHLNAAMILINLAPIQGLDGWKAWRVFAAR